VIKRSAQVQCPACLTNTEAECRGKMLNQFTLKAGFNVFFDDIFECTTLQTQVSTHLLKTLVYVFKVFYLINIRRFHAALLRFPVVVSRFRDTVLMADIFHGSSGYNRFNYSDDLMLNKKSFTHSDLLRWRDEYAGRHLNMNGTITEGTT